MDSSEELRLDLVQFPQPVVIDEVRVIPLGALAFVTNKTGGERLGATNPSSFFLDLFVNNIAKVNSATFFHLGSLDYKKSSHIRFVADQKIPTDGLVLRGWYSVLTIAVYGRLTSVIKRDDSPPPPPPPAARSKPPAVETRPAEHPLDYIQHRIDEAEAQAKVAASTIQPPPSGLRIVDPSDSYAVDSRPSPQDRGGADVRPGQYERGGSENRSGSYDRTGNETRTGQYERGDSRAAQYDRSDGRFGQYGRGGADQRSGNQFDRGGTDARSYNDDSRDSYGDYYGESRSSSKDRGDYYSRDRDRRSGSFYDSYDERRDSRDNRSTEYRRSGDFNDNKKDHAISEQRGNLPDHRCNLPDQRGNLPDQRNNLPDQRGNFTEQRSNLPDQRGNLPEQRGNVAEQRGSLPEQRGNSANQRGNLPDQRGNLPDERRNLSDQRGGMDQQSGSIESRKKHPEVAGFPEQRPNFPESGKFVERSRVDSPEHTAASAQRGSFAEKESFIPRVGFTDPQQSENAPEKDSGQYSEQRGDWPEKKRTSPNSNSSSRSRSRTPPRSPSNHSQSPDNRGQSPDWWSRSSDGHSQSLSSRSQSPARSRQGSIDERSPPQSPIRSVSPPAWQRQSERDYNRGSRGTSQEARYGDSRYPSDKRDDSYNTRRDAYGSDEENQEGAVDFETISSDEDMGLAEIDDADNAEMDYYDDALNFAPTSFNPLQVDLAPLDTFGDPSLTPFELMTHQWEQMSLAEMEDTPGPARTLLDQVDQFTDVEHGSKWVETVETLPPVLAEGLSFLRNRDPETDVFETLLTWTMEGLDLEKAVQQPEMAYKVRHLKMGIRLAGCLCACEPDITMRLLKEDVQNKLLDLYVSPFMSISLKLMIIQALDQTTRFKDGIDWFLGQHTNQSKESTQTTAYQRLVELLLTKQQVRAVAAITGLIRKVHTYEVLNKLAQATEYVVENMTMTDDDITDKGDNGSVDEEMDAGGASRLSDTYAETLILCLKEIHKVLVSAPQILMLPQKSLPLMVTLERATPDYDPYPNLYHMFNSCRFLECLFILVTSNIAVTHPPVFHTIRDVFRQLMRIQSGLLFLCSRPETTNGIIRSLTQSIEYNHDDGADDGPSQQLGIELIFHLQTLQYVDQLRHFHKKVVTTDYDGYECLAILRSLHLMTFTPVGRQAVVAVLSLDENIDPLLVFVTPDGTMLELFASMISTGIGVRIESSSSSVDDTPETSSTCSDYVVDLLLCILRHGDNVNFLQKYSAKLLTLSKQDSYPKLSEVSDWLSVTSSFHGYTYTSLDSIITQLKSFKEELNKLPKGLIMTLKVIKNLAVVPSHLITDETDVELKYKYTIAQLFSADCLTMFYDILQNIAEMMMYPWKQGVLSACSHLPTYISIVKPTMAIVKVMTQTLINAKGAAFKDVTALPTLFDIHSVLCTLPPSNTCAVNVSLIQKDLIDTIAAYTKPLGIGSESQEALAQSLWCLSLKELFRYILKAPYAYVSGLMILSELLPLPLPIQTRESLSDKEVEMVTTSRKLWSAHLHPVTTEMQTVINNLSGSTCHAQQQILRRVCWQLTDLSCQMATTITEFLLTTILETLADLSPPGAETDDAPGEIIASTQLSQLLDLLSFNLTQPVFKASVLSLTRNGSTDEKFTKLWPRLMVLLNSVKDLNTHVRAQECLASILQTLCDPDISLMSAEADIPINDQLANALPNSDLMSLITCAMVEHIGHLDHNYSSVLPCLRTMVMLTDHNYGFYHLKMAFDKHTHSLHNLFMRINVTFSKDSSDCLSSLSTVLELLRLLGMTQPVEDDQPITRDLKLTGKQLRTIMLLKPSNENHPLDDLETLLEECSKEEENLQSLFESIVAVTQIIRADTESESSDFTAPVMSETQPLSSQFAQRSVYTIVDQDDDRLTYLCWLANPAMEGLDEIAELSKCDLEAMCTQYIPEFNLVEELQRGFTPSEANLVKPRKLKDKRKLQDMYITQGGGGKKPFVAPMRGRGIVTRGMSSNGRGDVFRSRPPNTSRPPSMHVDDFVKLERNSATATPPPPHRRPEKDVPPQFTRGRGYERGRFVRGRGAFFSRGFHPRDRGGPPVGLLHTRPIPFEHMRLSPERRLPPPREGPRFSMRGSRRPGWGRVRGKDSRFMTPPGLMRGGRRDIDRIPLHTRSMTK